MTVRLYTLIVLTDVKPIRTKTGYLAIFDSHQFLALALRLVKVSLLFLARSVNHIFTYLIFTYLFIAYGLFFLFSRRVLTSSKITPTAARLSAITVAPCFTDSFTRACNAQVSVNVIYGCTQRCHHYNNKCSTEDDRW